MKNLISIFALAGILVCAQSSAGFEAVVDDIATQGMGCMTDIECEAQNVRVIDCDDNDCPTDNNNESFLIVSTGSNKSEP